MARIDKKFVLSTSQLNSHKFRCLTEGAQLDDFIANPIMYWLHQTPEGKGTNEPMPIGFWEDIKIEGDEITAYPNINDSDAFALSIGKMIEHGTLRAASIEADPIELDTDKKNWLPGQKLPTLKRFNVGEASIVDRGSNKGAIAKLKHEGKVVQLSDQQSAADFFNLLQKPAEDSMKIKLNAKASKALKLAEDTELDATDVVDKLVDLVEEKEAEMVTLKKAANTEKITLMLNKAKDEGKIVAGQIPGYQKLAEANFDEVKGLIDSMTGTQKLRDVLGGNADDNSGEVAELMKEGFSELFNNGGLARLKALDPESYKLKFKQRYGRLPNE